ncbi:hypothetical protein D9V86_09900 [Bacteroidetes/Chlorobi group bacterium ChocPot_Mid]|nr:MAG: hypothetical protein D9V86_09900 [Bacteroidetes/Chlorobi group bacterium ChocPot_Mid]
MENLELERLESVAKKYFNSLSNLAKLIDKKGQTFYSYRKRKSLGWSLIHELQEKLNINPEYIRNGREPMLLENKSDRKIESNVDEVQYAELIELPDIRTLTPQQMKKIKEWAEENIPKINKILETVDSTVGA